jgi:hypothetical protein
MTGLWNSPSGKMVNVNTIQSVQLMPLIRIHEDDTKDWHELEREYIAEGYYEVLFANGQSMRLSLDDGKALISQVTIKEQIESRPEHEYDYCCNNFKNFVARRCCINEAGFYFKFVNGKIGMVRFCAYCGVDQSKYADSRRYDYD